MAKKLFWGFLLVGAISMLAMSFHYLIHEKSGILNGKEVADALWYQLLFKLHVLFGLIAIFMGPIQFYTFHKKGYGRQHKLRGYVYVISIGLSGVAGLIVAQFAMGGYITTVGFSLLAVLWLSITTLAVQAAIQRKTAQHKSLMILSYSLTFTAITQRTLLLVPLLTKVSFMPIYQLSAWLPWIINLSIAFLIIKPTKNHYEKT